LKVVYLYLTRFCYPSSIFYAVNVSTTTLFIKKYGLLLRRSHKSNVLTILRSKSFPDAKGFEFKISPNWIRFMDCIEMNSFYSNFTIQDLLFFIQMNRIYHIIFISYSFYLIQSSCQPLNSLLTYEIYINI